MCYDQFSSRKTLGTDKFVLKLMQKRDVLKDIDYNVPGYPSMTVFQVIFHTLFYKSNKVVFIRKIRKNNGNKEEVPQVLSQRPDFKSRLCRHHL